MLKSQSEEDAVSLDSLTNDKQQFLHKAIQNYILCLKTGVGGGGWGRMFY